MDKKMEVASLFALIILFAYLTYLIVTPFIGYIILGLLFAFVFYPLYDVLDRFLWSGLAAGIVMIGVLLLIIIPSIYLGASLVLQATGAYQAVQEQGISIFDESSIADYLQERYGIDVHDELVDLFRDGRETIKDALPAIITSTGAFLLGLFLMFFVMYYALKDGAGWWRRATDAIPIRGSHRESLREKLKVETRALVYGQLATTILVGVIGGIAFWYAGIPNAIFWGFLMVIMGLVPVLGAPVVYVPAGIWLIAQGNWIAGTVVLVVVTAAHLFIDNILKPKMVSARSEIHPATVLIGAIGGIYLMGFVGFLIGPLILSIFFTLLGFDYSGKEGG